MNRLPRIVIVDDEAPARMRLRALTEDGGLGSVVAEARDGAEALRVIAEHRPDIVLLDVRMPRMDGLEVAAHLARDALAPAIVFTTAYEQHALAAFDARAVDYLLKPVRADRLAAAIERAARLAPAAIDGLAHRSHIGAGQRLVPVVEIRLLKAEHKYVSAYYPDGEVLLEESLGALEAEFGDRFMRVHRNALVALAYVRELERDAAGRWQLGLEGLDLRVEVSRRMAPAVRQKLSG